MAVPSRSNRIAVLSAWYATILRRLAGLYSIVKYRSLRLLSAILGWAVSGVPPVQRVRWVEHYGPYLAGVLQECPETLQRHIILG